mgnify:FL=1|nr:MAG TPA: multidrug resistance protein cholerae, outer membrane protein [Caudoviricetes sp.]
MKKSGLTGIKNKTVTLLLAVCVLFSAGWSLSPMECAAAGAKTLTLATAKKLAVANSDSYEKVESQLAVKQASLSQAYRSIREKQKNMSTFRWSPLLSFKFPTKPDLSEAYEFQFKPIEIQSEIDSLKHQLTDVVLEEYEKVSTLFVDAVVLDESITFNEKRLAVFEEQLVKDKAKLKLGEASQNDIDILNTNITSLQNKIATDRRSYEQSKKKLSDAIGMDVTTGYSFENPFVSAEIERTQLQDLTQYTLDHDQSYYDVCMAESTALISLRTNYNLMNGQYGSKMNYISGYVNQVYAGTKVNKKAFKSAYETFLQKIDEPWQGKKKILFIRIPKEWFKGAISGIRYVEDEPYALYESALEYEDARLERENAQKDLTDQVADTFENYVSLRNAYLAAVEAVNKAEKSLTAAESLNKLGELTNEEFTTEKEDYEELQNEMFSALADYTKALYSFDRLTCGGVSALLEDAGADLNAGGEGNSYVEAEYEGGAYYYMESIIEQEQFRLNVYIPDDFSVEVTHFELWCDGKQIGERTAIDKSIRHLALATESIDKAFIRFYNDTEFVDDCEIDPSQQSGELQIVMNYMATGGSSDKELGEYSLTVNAATGIATVELSPQKDREIAYYRISTSDGVYLTGDSYYSIEKGFRYLSLLENGIADLNIEFYDASKNKIFEGYFETAGNKLMEN